MAELQLEQVTVHMNFRPHEPTCKSHVSTFPHVVLRGAQTSDLGFYLQHPQLLQGVHPADSSCDISALGQTMSKRMVLKQLSRCISQCCSLCSCHPRSSWSSLSHCCSSASLQLQFNSGSKACRQPVELRLCIYSSVWPLQGVIHGFHLLLLLQYKSCCLNIYLSHPLLSCVSGSNNCQLSFCPFISHYQFTFGCQSQEKVT